MAYFYHQRESKFRVLGRKLMKMKFSEPRSLRTAMSPTLLATWTLGMGVMEYPNFYPRRWVSIFCLVINFTIQLTSRYSSYVTNFDLTLNHASSDATLPYILAKTFYVAVIMCRGQAKSLCIMTCLNKLDTLNKLLKKLDIPSDYGNLFKEQIIQHVGFPGLICGLELLNILYFDRISQKLQLWSAIGDLCYSIITSSIVDISLITLTRYIGKRFQHLNAYLVKLNPCPELRGQCDSWLSQPSNIDRERRSVRAINEQRMVNSIREIRQIHRCLCKSARELNEAFGVQIFLSLGISVSSVVYLLLDISDGLTEATMPPQLGFYHTMIHSILVALHAMKIVYIVHCCSTTSAEAQRTRCIMKKVFGAIPITEVQDENHVLSLELMHNPLQFTAHGLMALDYSLIRNMVGMLIAYRGIQIQMRFNNQGASTTSGYSTVSAMDITS